MGDTHARARNPQKKKKSSAPAVQRPASGTQHAPPSSNTHQGPIYRGGPVMGPGRAVQTKPIIGPPNDRYEQEADSVAEQVVSGRPVHSVSRLSDGDVASSPAASSSQGTNQAPVVHSPISVQRTDEPVQTAPVGGGGQGGGHPAMQNAAARAIHAKGSGEPLRQGTRSRLESHMGADLGHVRVHRDGTARDAARALNARAFTHGSDIWLGQDAKPDDTRLMAHEATHVLQQRGVVQRMLVQRDGEDETRFSRAGSSIDTESSPKKMEIARLEVPRTKARRMRTRPIKWEREERDTDQRAKWDDDVKSDTDARVEDKLRNVTPVDAGGQQVYYLKSQQRYYLVGTMRQIKDRSRRPGWDKNGAEHSFDVDHIQENQLGGPDDPGNYWLWDASANRSSGSLISSKIRARIRTLLDEALPELGSNTPTPEEVESDYEVEFPSVVGRLAVSGDEDSFWEPDEIKSGAHLPKVRVIRSDSEIDEIRGSPTSLSIFTSSTGGDFRTISPWSSNSATGPWNFYDNFRVMTVTYGGGSGSVSGQAFNGNRWIDEKSIELPISPKTGVIYGGYINGVSLQSQISELTFKTMSPIDIYQADLVSGKGIVARGRLTPTIPIIRDANIDVVIDGNDVYLSKVFKAGDFDFPGPIEVTGASLEVRLGTVGVEVVGDVFFKIDKVGEGKISGLGSSSRGFNISGKFNFDPELFDPPAEMNVSYDGRVFRGSVTLSIGSGRVKGVDAATLTVSVEGARWQASGTLEPSIRGVENATLGAKIDENGLEVEVGFQFGQGIPRLRGGRVTGKVQKGDAGYSVEAAGNASLDVPGLQSAEITAEYKNGAFKAEATLAYEKGMLSASLTAGVTNMDVGENGRPAGDPTPNLTLYGQGRGTVTFTPWLQGTLGIKLLQNGQVEVMGEVGLPDEVEVFPEKAVNKEIFSIGIDIPIVGVAVAGQRVGIFVNISGGLSARASIGPGKLKDTRVTVVYNPEDESSTRITGSARFVVPASAGLRLFVRGALGAGIPIVSAQAGIEIGGELGIEGEASAGAVVEYTPATGVSLEADVTLRARPKFTFDITGFVLVEADLLLTTIELYSKRWQLASFEFGSDMEFGLIVPVKVSRDEPFELSLSDVEFIEPEIDPLATVRGLISNIA